MKFKLSIISSIIASFAIFSLSFQLHAELTPVQAAAKAAQLLSSPDGVSAAFTVSSNGKSMKGTIKTAGNKFTVQTPASSTWYDGKSLYTFNPRTQETTVTFPDAGELLESNPLLYVKGGANGFNVTFSPVKRTGKYVLDLVPRNKKNNIEKLTFTIGKNDFKIEKISVLAGGKSSTVTVNSLETGQKIPSTEFAYPKAKFPNAEIIDLR